MGKTLGYARISTNEGQDVASQKAMLEKLGAVVVFTDIGNGSSLDGRDQLEAAIRLLDPGDELLALHPDRLARDTADLFTIGKRVLEKKAVLRINDPNIVLDGADIMAEVVLTVFGMVGMMEKHFIKARQRRGIEAAKLRGVSQQSPLTMCGSFARKGSEPLRLPSVLKLAAQASTGRWRHNQPWLVQSCREPSTKQPNQMAH